MVLNEMNIRSFLSLVQHRDIGEIKKELKEENLDPSFNNNVAIRWAVNIGFTEGVVVLLSDDRVDPSAADNYAIKRACSLGHLDIVKILLADDRVNPVDNANSCLYNACVCGHYGVVELLLNDERIDPSACNNWCIRSAIIKRHPEIVKILIKRKEVDVSLVIDDILSSGYLDVIDAINQRDPNLIKEHLNNIAEHSLLNIFLDIKRETLLKLLKDNIISEEKVLNIYSNIGNGYTSQLNEREVIEMLWEHKRKKREKIIDDLI